MSKGFVMYPTQPASQGLSCPDLILVQYSGAFVVGLDGLLRDIDKASISQRLSIRRDEPLSLLGGTRAVRLRLGHPYRAAEYPSVTDPVADRQC